MSPIFSIFRFYPVFQTGTLTLIVFCYRIGNIYFLAIFAMNNGLTKLISNLDFGFVSVVAL